MTERRSNSDEQNATATRRAETDFSADTLVSIRNLHVHFRMREGEVKAISGLNLEIKKGETLGLVGESGCGKSVTMQAILRIVPPPGRIVDGSILMATEHSGLVDIVRAREYGPEMMRIRRNDISVVFQEPMTSLSPIHTVGNQIVEAVKLRRRVSDRDARDMAIDMLRRVGIPKAEERIDAYTFELSGGMRQRAMIAMALASEPKLLIADEPTTAIHVTIQAQILELLQRLQQDYGMSILIITHDLGVVASLADRIAVMYRGKAVEQAATKEIFAAPAHPYTKGLIRSIPNMDDDENKKKLWTIRGVVPHPYAVVPGCPFHPRCDSFMAGVCDVHEPTPRNINPDHYATCHLYNDEDNT